MKFYSSLQVKSIFVAKAVAWIVANIFYQSDFLSNVFRAFAFVLIFVFCVLDIRKHIVPVLRADTYEKDMDIVNKLSGKEIYNELEKVFTIAFKVKDHFDRFVAGNNQIAYVRNMGSQVVNRVKSIIRSIL